MKTLLFQQLKLWRGFAHWWFPFRLSFRYDSLTGVPSYQRALAFEKGSVLFNIGALYTQIGARQDRSATAGIDRAIDAFQRAAGSTMAKSYIKILDFSFCEPSNTRGMFFTQNSTRQYSPSAGPKSR